MDKLTDELTEQIMEKVCGQCHWPHVSNADPMDDQCHACETCALDVDVRAALLKIERETARVFGLCMAGQLEDLLKKSELGGG